MCYETIEFIEILPMETMETA